MKKLLKTSNNPFKRDIDWVLNYIGSAGWNFRKNEFLNTDPEELKQFIRNLKFIYNPTLTNNAVYHTDGTIEYGPNSDLYIIHEIGHAINSRMYKSLEKPKLVNSDGTVQEVNLGDSLEDLIMQDLINELLFGSDHILELKRSNSDDYNINSDENYGDKIRFLKELNDLGIFDSNQPVLFTDKHYDAYMKSVPETLRCRFVKTNDKNKVITIMNSMALNTPNKKEALYTKSGGQITYLKLLKLYR